MVRFLGSRLLPFSLREGCFEDKDKAHDDVARPKALDLNRYV